MTLVELMQKYREEQGLSQRQFAAKCGLSNSYVSVLERGVNPSTGKPVVPTLVALKQIADGMGMSLDTMLSIVDDMPVSLKGTPTPSEDDTEKQEVIDLFESLSDEQQQLALSLLRQLADRAK